MLDVGQVAEGLGVNTSRCAMGKQISIWFDEFGCSSVCTMVAFACGGETVDGCLLALKRAVVDDEEHPLTELLITGFDGDEPVSSST